jgi:hypothetical protein
VLRRHEAKYSCESAAVLFLLRSVPNPSVAFFGFKTVVGFRKKFLRAISMRELSMRLCVGRAMLDKLLLLLANRAVGLGETK